MANKESNLKDSHKYLLSRKIETNFDAGNCIFNSIFAF